MSHMDHMFYLASSFKQKLCGAAWVNSKAKKDAPRQFHMFQVSPGSIADTVCAPASVTTHAGQDVSRQPLPDRELIVRTGSPTSTMENTMACPNCGTFKKSGRKSCCAPGGAWFKNCGGAHNKNVEHKWFEGVAACKRKSKSDGML